MIVSAPIQDLVRLRLLEGLDAHGFSDVKISENLPEPRPDYLVELSAASDEGITDVILDHWSFTVRCWGPLEGRDRTERLSAYTAGILRELEGYKLGDSFVYDVTVSQVTQSPDPDTRCPRYVFLARLICRALIV